MAAGRSADVFRSRSLHAIHVLAARDSRIKVIKSGSPIGAEGYGLMRGKSAYLRILYTGLLGGSYSLRSIQSGDVLAVVPRSDHAAEIAALLAGEEEVR